MVTNVKLTTLCRCLKMCTTPQIGSGTRFGDELAHKKGVCHSGFMTLLWLNPWVQIQRMSAL